MSSFGRFVMESQRLRIVCAAVVTLDWAYTVVREVLRSREHAREFVQPLWSSADAKGLRPSADFRLDGAVDGVSTTFVPMPFECCSRNTASWAGRPAYRVEVPCAAGER